MEGRQRGRRRRGRGRRRNRVFLSLAFLPTFPLACFVPFSLSLSLSLSPSSSSSTLWIYLKIPVQNLKPYPVALRLFYSVLSRFYFFFKPFSSSTTLNWQQWKEGAFGSLLSLSLSLSVLTGWSPALPPASLFLLVLQRKEVWGEKHEAQETRMKTTNETSSSKERRTTKHFYFCCYVRSSFRLLLQCRLQARNWALQNNLIAMDNWLFYKRILVRSDDFNCRSVIVLLHPLVR